MRSESLFYFKNKPAFNMEKVSMNQLFMPTSKTPGGNLVAQTPTRNGVEPFYLLLFKSTVKVDVNFYLTLGTYTFL